MSAAQDVVVTDSPEHRRWEARVDGALAGVAVYRRDGGVITFVHTEVEPTFEGRGIGGALARTSLDAARAQGLRVVASCPFYEAWIDKHPAYQDLLVAA